MRTCVLLAAMAATMTLTAGDVKTAYVFSASHLDITFTGHPPFSYARAHRIFDAALNLAESQPDFRFVIENQYFLEEYLRTHPQNRKRLAAVIRSGRIELAAQWSSMLQNPFTGEDVARNILYAVTFAQRELDHRPRMQSLSDTPGQTGQLPQLLGDAGLAGVIITRAGPKDAQLFEWEGVEGSRARVVNPPGGYAGGFLMGMGESLEAMEGKKLAEFELSDISPDIFPNRIKQPASLEQFLGFAVAKGLDRILVETAWDNIMPAERLSANIAAWNERHGAELKLVSAFPSTFLAKHWPVKAAQKTGEIPSVWFNGGWSLIGGYQQHMRTTHELLRAEKWATLAQLLIEKPYPTERLRRGWHEHLITLDHEGHDLAPQTREAEMIATVESGDARLALATHVRNPGAQDIALVVFNPLNWKRTGLVKTEVALVGDPFAFFTRPWHKLQLLDAAGNQVPFEILSSKSTIIRTLEVQFRAENVPPLGWKTFYLRPSETDRAQPLAKPEPISSNQAGPVAVDTANGAVTLGGAVQVRYYHQPEQTTSSPGFFRQRDSGSPVNVRWKNVTQARNVGGQQFVLTGEVGDAQLTVNIQSAAGVPLRVQEAMKWRGGKPIKLVRETRFQEGGKFIYGTPFASRPLDCLMPAAGPEKEGSFDTLARDLWEKSREYDGWAAWQKPDHTIVIASEDRGGRFEASALRNVLLYSDGSMLAPDPMQPVFDEFRTGFLLDLNVANADHAARLGWEAYNPLQAAVSVSRREQGLSPEFSGAADSPNVIMTAVKMSESGMGVAARAYALTSQASFPSLAFGATVPSNVLEEKASGSKGAMRRFEVRTVLVPSPSKPKLAGGEK